MKLVLIRHGRTAANEGHLYCGKTDLALSENGKAELKRIRYGHGLFEPAAMRVLTSGMKRCEQTLALLFGDLPHESDAAFCEMDFGRFEMHGYEELKNDPDYLEWISGDNEANVAPGGESGERMRKRVDEGLGRLLAEGRDTLLVTHGGVIAAIMARLFPEEQRNRYEWQPEPGGGYVIDTSARSYVPLSKE